MQVQDRGPQDADEIDALKDAGLQIPNIAELWVVQVGLCLPAHLSPSHSLGLR